MIRANKVEIKVGKDYKNLDVKLMTNFQQTEILKCFYLRVLTPNIAFNHDAEAIIFKDEMNEKHIEPETIESLSHMTLGNWRIVGLKKTALLKVPGIILFLKNQRNLSIN